MSDALTALLQSGGQQPIYFSATSRYHGIATATFQTRDGSTILYVRRRFLPDPGQFALLQEHTVTEGERLDNITARYLGDPEQFWRACDGNDVMDPRELTETPGDKIRITLPEGMPGTTGQ